MKVANLRHDSHKKLAVTADQTVCAIQFINLQFHKVARIVDLQNDLTKNCTLVTCSVLSVFGGGGVQGVLPSFPCLACVCVCFLAWAVGSLCLLGGSSDAADAFEG